MAGTVAAYGRRIEYEVSEPVTRDRPVLVFHHGTPGAALLWADLVRAAGSAGLPAVVLSRPGYAGSDRQPGRRVVDAADDVTAVLDHLGAGRFVAAGWSGGGPHALACGARLAPRCAGVAVIAGVAPYEADGLDWAAGMGPENVEEFALAALGEERVRPFLEELRGAVAGLTPDTLGDALGGLVSDPDRAALAEPAGAWVVELLQRGLGAGCDGQVDDDLAFVRDWGFDPAEVAVPVVLWRAGLDLMVPPAHGRWLAAHLPGPSVTALDGEGHISIVLRRLADIVRELVGVAGPL